MDMKRIKTHEDLDVWKKSLDLVVKMYQLTELYPKEEKYGLVSQIRRAVISIPANIAEGSARKGNKEFIQFLQIASASANELETLLIISERLQITQEEKEIMELLLSVKRMIIGLIKYLKTKVSKSSH